MQCLAEGNGRALGEGISPSVDKLEHREGNAASILGTFSEVDTEGLQKLEY